MKEATYCVIRFPLEAGDRYVSVAWNYAQAVLLSPGNEGSYTEARATLDKMCKEHGVLLRWFDGSYVCGSDGLMVPDDMQDAV